MKTVWYLVWSAMALVAGIDALAPQWILSGKAGFLAGILLFVIAVVQLVFQGSLLERKELGLAVVVLVLFGDATVQQRARFTPARIDFSAYYIAAHLAAEHPPAQLYYQTTYSDGRIDLLGMASGWKELAESYGVHQSIAFVYPPFFAVLLRPLAHFSYGVAYGLWNALAALLTVVSGAISLVLGGKRLNLKSALILSVGLFSFCPFYQELLVGQVAGLLLFLCAMGTWLLSKKLDWLSAFCFAVATMIKITPILAVPLLVMHRRWKWLAAYGCWMVLLMGFSVWQAGWAAHEQFFRTVLPSTSCGIALVMNISIVAWVQELFLGRVPRPWPAPVLPPLACAVSKAVSLAVLVGVMIRFYLRRSEESVVLHLMLMMLLSLAISPITWTHHYTLAILPFLYLWCKMPDRGGDSLLLATVLVVGTNVTIVPLALVTNQVVALVVAGVVPCLTVLLVWFRIAPEQTANFS